MKRAFTLLVCVLLAAWLVACSDSPTRPDRDPPEDHDVSRDGVLHAGGAGDPENNCADCHGDNLRGGDVGVSCFECHGAVWN